MNQYLQTALKELENTQAKKLPSAEEILKANDGSQWSGQLEDGNYWSLIKHTIDNYTTATAETKKKLERAITPIKPFHISLPAKDFEQTKAFYIDFLGGKLSHEDKTGYINIELFGHQLTFHENKKMNLINNPEFHWGFNLEWPEFEVLAKKAEQNQNIEFILKPTLKDEGAKNERIKMFLKDPSGYQIEIKGYK